MDEKQNVLNELDNTLEEQGEVTPVRVVNPPVIPPPVEPKEVEFPANQDVTVTNKEIPVRVVNPPKEPKTLTEIKVTNLDEIKIPQTIIPESITVKEPKWYKPIDLTSIAETLKRLLTVVTKLEVPTDDPTKPIAVRLSDGESFYKALEYVLQNSGGSGGSALTWMDSSQAPTRATTVKVNSLQYAAVVNPDGTSIADKPYTTMFDFDVNSTYIYVGYALPGTATSAALWKIKKITFDANSNPNAAIWANGSTSFTNIWDNHTSYSYS